MDYYFNHIRLEPCYLINDIGVDIDSLLHFDKHIDRIRPNQGFRQDESPWSIHQIDET